MQGTQNPELLERQGLWTPHWASQLLGHALEDEPPKHLTLKTTGAWVLSPINKCLVIWKGAQKSWALGLICPRA